MKRHYKPNVAYELLIDGQYHYYGCHCRNKAILYESEIRGCSGNKLASLCNIGKMSRKEYNARAKTLYIWEFDTPQEALNKEAELITRGKEVYGEFCLNECIGNNRRFNHSDKLKNLFKNNRAFFVECGKKGIKNNPVLLRSKQVIQYDGDKLIAVYPSISAAAKAMGVEQSNIRKAAQHKNKTACGFRWEFVNP